MSARKDEASLLEDLEWLDSTGVGGLDAAKRTDFPSAEALEGWLHRKGQYPLWLRLKARDPHGIHNARRLHMNENTTDTIAALISHAQASTRKRTRTKGDRLSDLIADLRSTLDIEAHEDKARETARKDVERLERELREAKAVLKGGATVTPIGGPTAAEIRTWAHSEGVECPERGRVPEAVREAYATAQERAS